MEAADINPAVTGNDMNSTRKPDRTRETHKCIIFYFHTTAQLHICHNKMCGMKFLRLHYCILNYFTVQLTLVKTSLYDDGDHSKFQKLILKSEENNLSS
jgi:hypothetical protein